MLHTLLNIMNNNEHWQVAQTLFWKNEHSHWILNIRISLNAKFQLKQKNFDFLDQIIPKGDFRSQTTTAKPMKITIQFRILVLDFVRNFNLNGQFCFFGPNLRKRSISRFKQIKWTSPLNSTCSNYSRCQFSS